MRSLSILLLLCSATAGAAERDLRKEVIVAAPAAEAYAAWTTNAGAQAFFAPRANIELKIGGMYEILFAPDAPPGSRGAEGLHVLGWVPNEMVMFEWSVPPTLPELRKKGASTFVVIQLTPVDKAHTKVVLHQLGWGAGEDYDEAYAYFDKAWDVVLGRLQKRFADGKPLDFSKM